jgi:uncharacterized repeat protein (TIGR03803 family)
MMEDRANKLTPPASGGTPWNFTMLHSFSNVPDGAYPYASLIFDQHGALYGTTRAGGNSEFGTVYKLTPPVAGGTQWTETVLYSFMSGADGADPFGGLIIDQHGALYGTTREGANAGNGTVYKLTPPPRGGTPWNFTVLHSFTGAPDGGSPSAGLILDRHDALYGSTGSGGNSGYGTVFKVE